MRKLLAVLLSLFMVVSLFGCENAAENGDGVADTELGTSEGSDFEVAIEDAVWQDYIVEVNGHIIKLSETTVAEAEEWFGTFTCRSSLDEEGKLDAGLSASGTFEDWSIDLDCRVLNYNMTDKSIDIKDCVINEVNFSNSDRETDIILPGGLNPKTCSINDVIEKWGQPTKVIGLSYRWKESETHEVVIQPYPDGDVDGAIFSVWYACSELVE